MTRTENAFLKKYIIMSKLVKTFFAFAIFLILASQIRFYFYLSSVGSIAHKKGHFEIKPAICHRSLTKDPKFPDLVTKFYKSPSPKSLQCEYSTKFFIELTDGKLYFHGNSGQYSCIVRQMYRINDDSESYGPSTVINSFPHSVQPHNVSDFFQVDCFEKAKRRSTTPIYSDIFSNILENSSVQDKKGKWNVIIIGIESLSQTNAKYRLPKSLEKLDKLGGINQKWYNKVGRNTFPNAMALLTGLDVVKADIDREKPFDGLPFIWKYFKEIGYKTFFAEDSKPSLAMFNYIKKGFNSQPTDHYGRNFFKTAHNLSPNTTLNKGMCIQGRKTHEILWNYEKQFIKAYQKNHPIFSFSFVNEISHNYLSTVSYLDEDLFEHLEWLENNGIFKNTFVIIWGDHGHRMDKIRSSPLLGRLEVQTPFSSIVIPTEFQTLYPKFCLHLGINSNRLSTSYDLHHTLKHVLCLSSSKTDDDCVKCLLLTITLFCYYEFISNRQ